MPTVERCAAGSVPTRTLCFIIMCYLIFLTIDNTAQVQAQNRENDIAPEKAFRFITLQDLHPIVNQRNARAALEMIMQRAIAKKSYPYSVKLDFMDPSADVANRIQKGGYHFVTLSGLDYLKYRDKLHLRPILIPSTTNQPTETLILLSRIEKNLSTMAQQQERTLIIENGRSGDLAKVWLNTLLANKDLPESNQFFTTIRRIKKPARAVLPVFFKQADACVVTQSALTVINNLNPQIGQQVKPLFRSKGLVRMLICATDKTDPNYADTLIKELINVEHNVDTQQAMTIIQMKQFHRVHPQDLEATEALVKGHKNLAIN